MNSKGLFSVLSLLALGVAAQAQQQIVDATGATPGSVTTIGAALSGSATDIVVKNTGLYNEALLITRDVTVRGEDPNNRPIIALAGNASQPALGTGDGVYIGGTSGGVGNQTIVFKNFILIPALTGGPTDDAFSITPNVGGILNVTLENILCAPNNGSNQPLATSVWDNPNLAAAGVVRIPDDGVYLMDNQFGGFDGDIQATFTDFTMIGVGGATTNGDGLVVYPGDGGNGSATFTRVGTSYCRWGMQASDNNNVIYTITGTQAAPGWVSRKNTSSGFTLFQGTTWNIDHLVSVENGIFGVRADADTITNFSMTNSLIANNGAEGFWSNYDPGTAKSWSISNSTFYNNGRNGTDISNIKIEALATNLLTLTVSDSIVAGPGSTGFENLGAAVIVADNSGIVTAGTNALLAVTRSTSTGTVTITDAVNADPAFSSVAVDPVGATSFDVTSSSYATASTTGGALNGWGDGPTSSVSEWSIY